MPLDCVLSRREHPRMALVRLAVQLFVLAMTPVQLLLLPVSYFLVVGPLRFWLGHRVLRWLGNFLMLSAAWAGAMSLWRVAHGEFWPQMIWGPLVGLALGVWLKGVQRGALTGQLRTDPSIDVLAEFPAETVRLWWLDAMRDGHARP